MRTSSTLIGLLPAAVILISGCAGRAPAVHDVSSPSQVEIVQFDGVVNVPIEAAYANVLENAQRCWHTDYSGEIQATVGPAPVEPALISFVVPGKLVGSRIPLATVRLFPLAANQTRVLGSSASFPGEWHLSDMKAWAEAVQPDCSAIRPPSA